MCRQLSFESLLFCKFETLFAEIGGTGPLITVSYSHLPRKFRIASREKSRRVMRMQTLLEQTISNLVRPVLIGRSNAETIGPSKLELQTFPERIFSR